MGECNVFYYDIIKWCKFIRSIMTIMFWFIVEVTFFVMELIMMTRKLYKSLAFLLLMLRHTYTIYWTWDKVKDNLSIAIQQEPRNVVVQSINMAGDLLDSLCFHWRLDLLLHFTCTIYVYNFCMSNTHIVSLSLFTWEGKHRHLFLSR